VLDFVLALGLVAMVAGFGAHEVSAQKNRIVNDSIDPNENPVPGARYFVDFRARTAASYGHAFVWFGRVGAKKVEVGGLHPATESVIPYILGHLIPVPAETGASYGDLDEEYLTASYRVTMNEAEAKKVFAHIKSIQKASFFWHAPTYNCVMFDQLIASYMGLSVPGLHLLYPDVWVNRLRELNGRNPKIKISS